MIGLAVNLYFWNASAWAYCQLPKCKWIHFIWSYTREKSQLVLKKCIESYLVAVRVTGSKHEDFKIATRYDRNSRKIKIILHELTSLTDIIKQRQSKITNKITNKITHKKTWIIEKQHNSNQRTKKTQ